MSDTRTDAERLREQGLEVETVGEILGDTPDMAKQRTSFVIPRLENYPHPPLQPGIYFGLDEDTYHASPALSSHAIRDLACSPMLYWEKCRWMNPDYEEPEQQAHFDLGKAYECLILEGREAFEARFGAAPDKRDYPDALVTLKDIGRRLAAIGIEKCPPKKSDAIAKLRYYEPDAQLWEEIEAAALEGLNGRVLVPAKALRKIEVANRLVQLDKEQADAVNNGLPQVTLVWTCAATGILMKCRVDNLLMQAMVDAKTFVNQKRRSMESAVALEIGNYRYNLQPSVYFEGARAVRQLVREHGASVVHSCDLDLDRAGIDSAADTAKNEGRHANRVAWAMKWAQNKAPDEWLWLFICTSPTITRLVHYPRGGTTKMMTDEIVNMMKRRYRLCAETYGTDEWLDLGPRIDLADEDIPRWATEI